MPKAIRIHLGTTNSCMAVMEAGAAEERGTRNEEQQRDGKEDKGTEPRGSRR
jgi:molecular chaperone DnaK (HSP70)